MNQQQAKTPVKPGYKQLWPWLVFSIPLLTIVAGVITYFIAADQPHNLVKDDYFKEGLAVNRSLDKIKNASELGLKATLTQDIENQLLKLALDSLQPVEAQVVVTLSHPTQSKLDRVIKMESVSKNEFLGQLPELPAAYWYVSITDDQGEWEIKSRWHVSDSVSLNIDATQSK